MDKTYNNEIVKRYMTAANELASAVNHQLFGDTRQWHWTGNVDGFDCDFGEHDKLIPDEMVPIVEHNLTYDDYAKGYNSNAYAVSYNDSIATDKIYRNEAVRRYVNAVVDLANAVDHQVFDDSRSWCYPDSLGGFCYRFDNDDLLDPGDMILIVEHGMTCDDYAEWREAFASHADVIGLYDWLKGERYDSADEVYDYAKAIRHKNLCNDLHDLYQKKNADYGNSFADIYAEVGMPYAYGHMAEKLRRIRSLMNQPANVKGESMRDSLVDLANYAILTIVELDAQKETYQ